MKFGVREICDVVFKAKSTVKIGNKIFKRVSQFFISIQQKLLQQKAQLQQYMQLVVKVTLD